MIVSSRTLTIAIRASLCSYCHVHRHMHSECYVCLYYHRYRRIQWEYYLCIVIDCIFTYCVTIVTGVDECSESGICVCIVTDIGDCSRNVMCIDYVAFIVMYSVSIITDVDECSESASTCSHTCKNTDGGFTCSCPPGMMLDNDEKTCVSKYGWTMMTRPVSKYSWTMVTRRMSICIA